MPRRSVALVTLATAIAAAVTTTPAQADDDAGEVAAITAGILLVGTDAAFFANAIAVTAIGERAEPKISLAQSLVTGLQIPGVAVGFGIAASARDGSEILAPMAPFGMVVNTLFAHGIWTSARPEHDVREVFAASSVIGVNAGWTSLLLGYALEPKLDMQPIGIAMAVTSAIGVGVSIPYALERPGFRAGWVGNAAWATTLFGFGIAGAVGLLDPSDRHEDPRGPHHSSTDETTIAVGPVDVSPIVPHDAVGAMGILGHW